MYTREQLESMEWYGTRVAEKKTGRVVVPVLGAGVVRSILENPDIVGAEDMRLLLKNAVLPAAARDHYMKTRMLVRKVDRQGVTWEPTPRLDGLGDLPLNEYSDDVAVLVGKGVIDGSEKKLQLAQVLSDVDLSDKLALSLRRLVSLRRHAVVDTVAAAATLQTYLRSHGFPKYSVSAGSLEKTHRVAAKYVREAAEHYPQRHVIIDTSCEHNDMIFKYNDHGRGPVTWYAKGPMQWVLETAAMYRIASAIGPANAMNLFSWETAVLGICLFDGSNKPYAGVMIGYSDLTGLSPVGHAARLHVSTAAIAQRVVTAAKNVIPVWVGGVVVGSAVRISDRYAILNDHTWRMAVDADAALYVGADLVTGVRSLATDIVLARVSTSQAQWILREPQVNEQVVLAYSVGDSCEYTDVLSVVGVYGLQMAVTNHALLRPGTSGAAVIAVRDGALLGIFSTRDDNRPLCEVFTQGMFASAVELDSQSPAVEVALTAYDRMIARGLRGAYFAVRSALVPLKTDAGRAGVGVVMHGGRLMTTLPVDDQSLAPAGGGSLTFTSVAPGLSKADYTAGDFSLPNVRRAVYGEPVFAMTKTLEGATAVSDVATVVHVDLAGAVRIVGIGDGAVSLAGAVIVSLNDGAVVGAYQKEEAALTGDRVIVAVPLHKFVHEPVLDASVLCTVDARYHDVVTQADPLTMQQMAYLGMQSWTNVTTQAAITMRLPLDVAIAYANDQWPQLSRLLADVLGIGDGCRESPDAPNSIAVWLGLLMEADPLRMRVVLRPPWLERIFGPMRLHQPRLSGVELRLQALEKRMSAASLSSEE